MFVVPTVGLVLFKLSLSNQPIDDSSRIDRHCHQQLVWFIFWPVQAIIIPSVLSSTKNHVLLTLIRQKYGGSGSFKKQNKVDSQYAFKYDVSIGCCTKATDPAFPTSFLAMKDHFANLEITGFSKLCSIS